MPHKSEPTKARATPDLHAKEAKQSSKLHMTLEAAEVAQGSPEPPSLPDNQPLGGAVPPIHSESHSLAQTHTFSHSVSGSLYFVKSRIL